MTNQATAQNQPVDQSSHDSGLAHGFAVFAGVIMIMSGAFQAIAGLVGLFANEFYVATRNYLFQFDATTWSVIHLLVGLLVLFAGIAVMSGQTWARVIGIILVGLSALANFTFIPYYPFWSLLIIALDVFVIWALAVYRPKS
jgi:hypothetical protein